MSSIELAKLAKATYAGPINHTLYSRNGSPLTGQKIIHGSFGRGYCRIFWNEGSTVVAFRGTRESIDWTISNFKALPVPLRDCNLSERVLVHRGFQNTLDYEDKSTNLRSLDAIFGYLREFNLIERRISITGHSMGAALALLFAVKLRAVHAKLCDENLQTVTTFAGPAVGLKGFKSFYGNLADRTIRFVNGADIVPFAPPAFYRHVGEEVWLHDNDTDPDIGWRRRLSAAFGKRFRGAIDDHSMDEYIRNLELRV